MGKRLGQPVDQLAAGAKLLRRRRLLVKDAGKPDVDGMRHILLIDVDDLAQRLRLIHFALCVYEEVIQDARPLLTVRCG